MDSEDSDSDDDSEDEESVGSGAPVLQLRKVAHEGCVNRMRPMTQNPHMCILGRHWSCAGQTMSDFKRGLQEL
ncbi:hypothetical protein COP1_044535 [Malus domestica]